VTHHHVRNPASMLNSEGLRHRSVYAEDKPVGYREDKPKPPTPILDWTEYLIGQGFFLFQIMLGVIVVIFMYGHARHGVDSYTKQYDLKVFQPKYGDSLNLYSYDNLALVLYKGNNSAHLDFLRDARKANKQTEIQVGMVNCDEHPKTCDTPEHNLGLSTIHVTKAEIGKEPAVLFYWKGTAVDSFQEAIVNGTITKPTSSSTRVAALVKWMDLASAHAEKRSNDYKPYDFDGEGMGGGYPGGYPGGMGDYGDYGGMGGDMPEMPEAFGGD